MFAFNRQSDFLKILSQSFLCLFLINLTACGFQLRGAVELSADLSPLYLQANNAYELARDVKGLLRSNNIKLAQTPGNANVTLTLLREQRYRRIISVNSGGQASEYLLTYTVDVKFSGAAIAQNQNGQKAKNISATSMTETITLNRTLIFDPDTVLAATNESETLYRDMKRDAARRILLKLQALSSVSK